VEGWRLKERDLRRRRMKKNLASLEGYGKSITKEIRLYEC